MKKNLWMAIFASSLVLMLAGCSRTPEDKLVRGIETGDLKLVQQAISENVKIAELKNIKIKGLPAFDAIKKNPAISGMLSDYIISNSRQLCKVRTVEEARILYSRGITTVVIHGDDNYSALHAAVRNGDMEMVKYLISIGFNVNLHEPNTFPVTPLRLAIRADNVAMAKLLIEHGASLKLVENEIPAGRGEYTEQLIRRIDTVAKIGLCTLEKIYRNSSIESKDFIMKLVGLGMSVNSINENGMSPLCFAVKKGDFEMAKFLIAKGAKANHGELGLAVGCNNLRMAEFLIANGAIAGNRELAIAVENNNLRMAEFLISKGARANYSVFDAAFDVPEMIKLLLDKGTEAGTKKEWVSYALPKAVTNNKTKQAALLLSNGADANSLVDEKCSALEHAVVEGMVDMVKLLLDNGADPNTRIKEGLTALGYVIKNDNNKYYSSYRSKCIEMAKILLDKGADPNTRVMTSYNSQPPLVPTILGYLVLSYNDHERDYYLEMIELLLKKGADPNIRMKTPRGETTVLGYAVMVGCEVHYFFALTKLLLNNGADPNACVSTSRGELAILGYAVMKCHIGMTKMLLSSGADPNIRINSWNGNFTALEYARKHYNSSEMIDLLKEYGAKERNLQNNKRQPRRRFK